MPYGNDPAGTVAGLSGRSAPERFILNCEISLLLLAATYTNGPPVSRPVAAEHAAPTTPPITATPASQAAQRSERLHLMPDPDGLFMPERQF